MDSQHALVKVERFTEVEVLDPEPQPMVMPAAALGFAEMIARAVVAASEPAKLSETEKQFHWAVAFQEWLTKDPKTGDARPANTLQAYRAAWEDFRVCCYKPYWKVEGLDVKAWVDDLRTRPLPPHVQKGLVRNGRRQPDQVGFSDATINQWLAAISAFYSYAEQYEVRSTTGQIVPLFDGVNPAKSRMVKRPKQKAFEKSIFLDVEQLRALLDSIRHFGAKNPAKALRDYALFMCYISTGARNSEVRTWRWGDLKRRGAVTFYSWANKGKSGTDELPGDAWAAVQEYLKLTGRLGSMQDQDYIFTPLSDHITRLRRADGSPVVGPDEWSTNRPLSPQEINRCLRQYAKAAGLEVDRLHVHCLRHSAYMLYREAGLSLEERSRLLHHSSLAITSIYDHAVAGQRNVGWAKASSLLGL